MGRIVIEEERCTVIEESQYLVEHSRVCKSTKSQKFSDCASILRDSGTIDWPLRNKKKYASLHTTDEPGQCA